MNPLTEINLFRGLIPSELDKVRSLARLRRVAKGACFFRQGQESDSFFVLLSGRIKVVQTTRDGRDVVIRYVHPNELFGCVAAFEEDLYPGTSEAIEDCVALAWDRKTTEKLLKDFPPVALNAMRLLGTRVRELQDRNRELATERVEQRVARALIRLVRQAGRKVADGVLIDFSIRRQDLAEMTGTTLYTVSRILSEWKENGMIRAERRKITVLSPHGLAKIAENS